jgi:hypothetical protein
MQRALHSVRPPKDRRTCFPLTECNDEVISTRPPPSASSLRNEEEEGECRRREGRRKEEKRGRLKKTTGISNDARVEIHTQAALQSTNFNDT